MTAQKGDIFGEIDIVKTKNQKKERYMFELSL